MEKKVTVYIRKANEAAARKLKVLAAQHGLSLGAMFDRIMEKAK